MDQSNFLKSGGGFLIAFLFGSATLHGILYYLVSDANDLFNGNSLSPLFLFILLYALVPLMILLVWRRWMLNKEIFTKFNTQSSAYARVKIIEKTIATLLLVGIVVFITYMFLWLFCAIKQEWLYFLCNVIQIAGLVIIGFGIIALLLVETNENDVEEKNENDFKADELSRKFSIEFKIVLVGWLLLAGYAISQFNAHVDVAQLFHSSDDHVINQPEDIRQVMNAPKTKISECGEIQGLLDTIQHTIILNTGNTAISDAQLSNELKKVDGEIVKFTTGEEQELKSALQGLDSMLKSSALSIDHIEDLRYWMAITENKILLYSHQNEEAVIDLLVPILTKAQNYFLVLFTILLFAGVVYWHAITMAYVETLRLSNKDADGKLIEVTEFSEINFTRGYIVIAFVFIVPILKPIESQNIQFNHPLWTASLNSISNFTSPESNGQNGNNTGLPNYPQATYQIDLNKEGNKALEENIQQLDSTINVFIENHPDFSIEEINKRLDTIQMDIKNLETADLSSLNARFSKIDSSLRTIKKQLHDIEIEVNKSKKR